uniref:Uncharacterized protein n=1 Tax=Apetahia longistigmata TaxID=360839 RepID=A0A1Z2QRE8_9ASTR|nr:hypothetical protein Ap_lon1Pt0329 [Apetahia longistigmata]ASA34061.1 hypothetical protein Ap_lon1Pt0329 [Apetahia longistigmata]
MEHNLFMKRTDSVVGVGLYSGFQPTGILVQRGKCISLSNGPLHLPKRKYLCYTKGASDNNARDVYEMFCVICLAMGRRGIVSTLLKKYASRNGAVSGSIIDFAKAEGGNWLLKRKKKFFRNENSIRATKACLWAELQCALLERTHETQYDIRVGFWSGAWKRFLFEGEETFSDTASNLDLVARESLRDALRTNLRNKPDAIREYVPHVHAWLRVRMEFLRMLEVLDTCDKKYQKDRADYLVERVKKIKFRDLYWFLRGYEDFRNSHLDLLNEEEFVSVCLNLVGEEVFIEWCLKMYDAE